MSMNGGLKRTKSSISPSKALTSPPRSGGMISKLMSGREARSRCSVTFMNEPARRRAVPLDTNPMRRPSIQFARHPQADLRDHGDDIIENGPFDREIRGLSFPILALRDPVDELAFGVQELDGEGHFRLLVSRVLGHEGRPDHGLGAFLAADLADDRVLHRGSASSHI